MRKPAHIKKGPKHRARMRIGALISVCLATVLVVVVCGFLFAQSKTPSAPQQQTVQQATDSQTTDEPANSATQTPVADETTQTTADSDLDEQLGYEHDTILLNIDSNATVESVNATLSTLDFVATKDVTGQDFALGFVKLELAEGSDVTSAVSALDAAGLKAQPDYIYHIADTTELETQSTYDMWGLSSLGSSKAWSVATADGVSPRIGVAVIDTGCLTTHTDLSANILATYNSGDKPGTTGAVAVTDGNGHGTHVAGIVASSTSSTAGVYGISHNAGLVIIKASTSATGTGFDTSTLAAGYTWLLSDSDGNGKTVAQENNVHVVNLSVGAKGNISTDDALYGKIDAAYNAQILTVCAAGNAQQGVPVPYNCIPGDYAKCLSVINLTHATATISQPANDTAGIYHVTRASDSNYNASGTTVASALTKDIAAPGTTIWSTTKDGSYDSMSGTSMASPYTAGCAAIVYAANQNLTAQQTMDILEATATDVVYSATGETAQAGWDIYTGYGEVSPYHAAQVATATLAAGSASILNKTSTSVSMSYKTGSAWTGTAAYGSPADWSWSVVDDQGAASNVASVSVDATSKTVTVTGENVGAAYVQATLKNTATASDTAYSVKTPITVQSNDLSGATIGAIGDQTYTGSAIMPKPTVTLNGVTLTKDVDYELAYANNTAVGTATVTVKGKGKYTGTATESFSIVQRSIANAAVSVSQTSLTYTGSAQVPTTTVTLDIDGTTETLAAGTDYTVAYSQGGTTIASPTAAGSYTVTVTGSGGFKDVASTTARFSISRKPIAAPTAKGGLTYSGSAQTGVDAGSGYTLSGTTSATACGTYYATATLADTANTQWSDGSTEHKSIAWSIVQRSIAGASVSAPNKTYTGSAQTPSPTVTVSGIGVLGSTDYQVTGYANNTAVGTASVTVEGKGNFTGTATGSFSITALDLSGSVVSNPGDQTYTGSAITPSVSVLYNGHVLSASSDYTVSYSNNVQPGTATVTVTGTGNYTGSKSVYFAIVAGNVPMYRLYNPNSGEHLFTADANEYRQLPSYGWKQEGVAWTAPSRSSTPVYRLYNPYSGDHHYTKDAREYSALPGAGWKQEGVSFYSDDAEHTPMYRLFNPYATVGTHHYTASAAEYSALAGIGWKQEGTAWYGL